MQTRRLWRQWGYNECVLLLLLLPSTDGNYPSLTLSASVVSAFTAEQQTSSPLQKTSRLTSAKMSTDNDTYKSTTRICVFFFPVCYRCVQVLDIKVLVVRESKETKCKKADALKIVCDVHTRNRFPIVSQTITTAQRRERDKRELGETHVDLLSREDQRKRVKKKDLFPNEN